MAGVSVSFTAAVSVCAAAVGFGVAAPGVDGDGGAGFSAAAVFGAQESQVAVSTRPDTAVVGVPPAASTNVDTAPALDTAVVGVPPAASTNVDTTPAENPDANPNPGTATANIPPAASTNVDTAPAETPGTATATVPPAASTNVDTDTAETPGTATANATPAPTETPAPAEPPAPAAAPPATQPTPNLEIITPPNPAPPIVGVNYHPYWGANQNSATRLALLDRYQQAGVTHVRMDVPWGQLETAGDDIYNTYGVNKLDGYLNELKQRNMKAVVMLWKPPLWSSGRPSPDYPAEGAIDGQPANPADYGEILAWVANRWPDTIEAIEMWNEPDQPAFWSNGQPDETVEDRAEAYANLIKTAYPVAKAGAPQATFILASPAGLGLHDNWFTLIYQNGIAGNFDAAAVHPYVQPSNTDPTLLPADNNWSVLGIQRVAAFLASKGDGGKPIWATEFGFSTHPNNGTEPNWLRGVTETQQSDYLLKTFTQLGSIPQVAGAFVYNDRDYPDPNIHKANYGLLRNDLTPKPGYYALKCAASGTCGRSTVVFY